MAARKYENAPPPDPEIVLTYPQVAELLQVSERTLATMMKRDEIPHLKFRGNVRFSRAALLVWIEQQTRGGSPKSHTQNGRDDEGQGVA